MGDFATATERRGTDCHGRVHRLFPEKMAAQVGQNSVERSTV